MKTSMTVLMAGAIMASASFASANDGLAEERYKMKSGRYTPSEESRRMALKQKAESGAMECVGCCRHGAAASSQRHESLSPARAEQVFRAKWGRYTRQEEARQSAVQGHAAHGEISKDGELASVVKPSFSDAWSRAKWGRVITAGDDGVERLAAKRREPVVLSGNMCDRPACCD